MDLYVPPPNKLLEQICWTGAVVSILGMLVSMPWVGPEKIIPPMLWLSYSIGGILFFGLFAVLIRVVFSPIGRQYDQEFSQRMEDGK